MRTTTLAALLATLACATPAAGSATPAPAARSGPYQVELLDDGGRPLPSFWHRGRSYVLGALGERYVLRVTNGSGRRVEVVASVDGRDVVDGRPASWERRGYIVDPGGSVTIDGYRLSQEAVAAFRFSSVPRSYAALQGDARDVGVVGVAFFPERPAPRLAPPRAQERLGDRARGESAPSAKSSAAPAPEAQRLGLGTEFGEEHASHVQLVAFERASARPDAVVTLRYDDREGLVALGVPVDGRRWSRRDEERAREAADPFRASGTYAAPPAGWTPWRSGS